MTNNPELKNSGKEDNFDYEKLVQPLIELTDGSNTSVGINELNWDFVGAASDAYSKVGDGGGIEQDFEFKVQQGIIKTATELKLRTFIQKLTELEVSGERAKIEENYRSLKQELEKLELHIEELGKIPPQTQKNIDSLMEKFSKDESLRESLSGTIKPEDYLSEETKNNIDSLRLVQSELSIKEQSAGRLFEATIIPPTYALTPSERQAIVGNLEKTDITDQETTKEKDSSTDRRGFSEKRRPSHFGAKTMIEIMVQQANRCPAGFTLDDFMELSASLGFGNMGPHIFYNLLNRAKDNKGEVVKSAIKEIAPGTELCRGECLNGQRGRRYYYILLSSSARSGLEEQKCRVDFDERGNKIYVPDPNGCIIYKKPEPFRFDKNESIAGAAIANATVAQKPPKYARDENLYRISPEYRKAYDEATEVVSVKGDENKVFTFKGTDEANMWQDFAEKYGPIGEFAWGHALLDHDTVTGDNNSAKADEEIKSRNAQAALEKKKEEAERIKRLYEREDLSRQISKLKGIMENRQRITDAGYANHENYIGVLGEQIARLEQERDNLSY